MLKIAAIDVGSNAIRLTVGEVDDGGNVRALENIRTPVRLGQDVFTLGALQEDSMKQAEEAFKQYQNVLKDAGVYRFRAVATSAMREASNGPELVDRIERVSGIRLEIIDSVEEARLIHQAVGHALDLRKKRALLIDIGGGSVEVTLSEDQSIRFTESYQMGAVRLLKIMEQKGDSGQSLLEVVTEFTASARREISRALGREKINLCVGTGGNVDEIGHLRQKIFGAENNHLVTLPELEQMVERFSGMTAAGIAQEFSLRPDRADVLLPAAIVLLLVARQVRVREIAIPSVGLKEGVLIDIADELSNRPHPARRERLLESAEQMGRKYQIDEHHAHLTLRLARQLFEQTGSLHGLDDDALVLLEVAALLHDIGHFINTIDHDKHGYYLLRATHLIGLSDREQEIVAYLVRYHRGKTSAMDSEGLKSLLPADRQLVLKLSALLSLADGMDVSHTGHIQRATLRPADGEWRLNLSRDLILEKWTLEKRKALFQEVFGVKLRTE